MLTSHAAIYSQYRGHALNTAPSVEPVSLSDVKAQLSIDGASDDTLLTIYITAARQHAEEITGLALITQTWDIVLDAWPSQGEPWFDGVKQGTMSALSSNSRAANVILPRYPLQSVDSITADAVAVTIADVFTADTYQKPGRLVVKSGSTWPSYVQNANAIVITYTAGFGDEATDVPAALRVGLLQMIASLYSHRGDECSMEDAWKNSGAANAFSAYSSRGL
jgi:uncharacterized phiE125 gp8 family phage protein